MTAREELLVIALESILGFMQRTEMELNAICITIVPSPEETEVMRDAVSMCERLRKEAPATFSRN